MPIALTKETEEWHKKYVKEKAEKEALEKLRKEKEDEDKD
jgi:hypothetical protein